MSVGERGGGESDVARDENMVDVNVSRAGKWSGEGNGEKLYVGVLSAVKDGRSGDLAAKSASVKQLSTHVQSLMLSAL